MAQNKLTDSDNEYIVWMDTDEKKRRFLDFGGMGEASVIGIPRFALNDKEAKLLCDARKDNEAKFPMLCQE